MLRRSKAGSGGASRRRLGVGALVAVMLVVPAAIAWACNPQASVSLDRTSYSPGQAINVYGSYFPGNASITVSGPTGSVQKTTSAGGSFHHRFVAPTRTGTYTISATRPTGGQAAATVTVAPPRAAAPRPRQQADSPSAAAPRAPSFDSPSVVRSERERSSVGGGGNDGGPGAQTSPGSTGAGPGSGVVSQDGALVFAGSAPAASTGTFSAAPAPATTVPGRTAGKRSSSDGSAPSEQAATGYTWSGFAPGETPSLSSAGDMASEGDTGSGLGLGIGLLAIGLLALVGGLTAAEVTRRRRAA